MGFLVAVTVPNHPEPLAVVHRDRSGAVAVGPPYQPGGYPKSRSHGQDRNTEGQRTVDRRRERQGSRRADGDSRPADGSHRRHSASGAQQPSDGSALEFVLQALARVGDVGVRGVAEAAGHGAHREDALGAPPKFACHFVPPPVLLPGRPAGAARRRRGCSTLDFFCRGNAVSEVRPRNVRGRVRPPPGWPASEWRYRQSRDRPEPQAPPVLIEAHACETPRRRNRANSG